MPHLWRPKIQTKMLQFGCQSIALHQQNYNVFSKRRGLDCYCKKLFQLYLVGKIQFIIENDVVVMKSIHPNKLKTQGKHKK